MLQSAFRNLQVRRVLKIQSLVSLSFSVSFNFPQYNLSPFSHNLGSQNYETPLSHERCQGIKSG